MKRPSLADLKGDVPALQAELVVVRRALAVLPDRVPVRNRLRREIERAIEEVMEQLRQFLPVHQRAKELRLQYMNTVWSKYKPKSTGVGGFFRAVFHDAEARWRTLSHHEQWLFVCPVGSPELVKAYGYLDQDDRRLLDQCRAQTAYEESLRVPLYDHIRARFRPYEQFSETWKRCYERSGLFSSDLSEAELSKCRERLLAALRVNEKDEFAGFPITDAGLARARKREQAILAEIDATIRRTHAAEERKKREQHAKERTRAAAAAHFKKTRELADTIKGKLRDQVKTVPVCPYCGRALGDEPHADHIHPVGLGGLSLPENMVYVCVDCNMKKHDKTLREFVRDEKLDWAAVERRLTLLGKRF